MSSAWRTLGACAAVGGAFVWMAGTAISQGALGAPTYTAAQAKRGEATYMGVCIECHGANLDDGQFAVPLKGPAFKNHWAGQGLDGPFNVMMTQMPPSNPGGLGANVYADVLAYILSKNGVAPGSAELPADADALKALAAPK
jgi:mono/diheme cytochrome c family protein